MKITDIKIRRVFPCDPLRAIASMTIDGTFAVHDIKVIHASNRWIVMMPSKKLEDGTFRDIAHPINEAQRARIERAVLDAYFAEVGKG